MTSFDPSTHPHRRFNPLTKEYILVSPHRMKRPWQGQMETLQPTDLPQYDPNCYLCPGNTRSGGQQNEIYKNTMVFENDFPALLPPPAPQPPAPSHPLLQSFPVQGSCDVLVYHPRHDLTLARLSVADIKQVIEEWSAMYSKRSLQEGINHVQIFENKGAMNGCSNPHPHGQIWSLSDIPTAVRTELASLHEYALSSRQSGAPTDLHGRPHLLLEYAHFETLVPREEGRVVVQNEHWVALVPWWAVWPFEILLLPYNRHIPSLVDLTIGERASFAAILSQITIRYDNLFATSFAYSMGIHQRPTLNSSADNDVAHLHLHFYPPLLRSATIRKFIVGFEQMGEAQRDLTAEQAAKLLRNCPEIHYLDTL